MAKIQILTQDNCPKCNTLKQYITHGIGEPYTSEIEWIHKQKKPEKYHALVDKYNIMGTPAIIIGDQVLRNTTPLQVSSFLRDYA